MGLNFEETVQQYFEVKIMGKETSYGEIGLYKCRQMALIIM